MKICILVTLLLPFAIMAANVKAADLYSTIDDDCLQSLKDKGVSLIIPRCYSSIGMPDAHCAENLDTILAADMQADVYLYPSPVSTTPEDQVAATISTVGDRKVGKYWVIVDNYQWKDKTYNRNFLKKMMDELKKKGKAAGIYTNEFLWEMLMGCDWTEMSSYPLWFTRNDGKSVCTPFKPFAGWKAPYMKQYANSEACYGTSLSQIC